MAGHHGLRASLHHKLAKLRKSTHGNAQGQTPTPNDHHNSTSTSVQIKKHDGQVVLATADGTKGHNHEHANPSTHNVIVDDNGSEGALIHDGRGDMYPPNTAENNLDGPDSYPGNILTVPWDSRKDDAIESLTWSMKGLTHGEDYVPNSMATGTPDQRQTEGNVPPYPLLNPPKCAGGGPVVDRSRFSTEVHRLMRKRKSAFAKLQPVTHSVSQHRDCKIYYDDNFCPSVPFSSSLQSRSVYRSHFEFAAPSVLDEEQDEALLSMRSPSNFSSWELEDSGEMCSRSSTVPPSTDSSTVLVSDYSGSQPRAMFNYDQQPALHAPVPQTTSKDKFERGNRSRSKDTKSTSHLYNPDERGLSNERYLFTCTRGSKSSGKRKEPFQESEDITDATTTESIGTKEKKIKTEPHGLRLACPFFKHNSRRYSSQQSCTGPGWETIHRVKEHIYRRHTQHKHQCHRCGEVFESSRSLVKHTRSQMVCKLQERGDADDIDQDTVARLKSRKKGPEQTEPERWIALYKILFPNDTIIPDPCKLIISHSTV
ncbi:hypothetical protein BKA67DRAFT_96281 [Truncatella angustata]|uniref:C2H2-type domain-containing protein n=1 Tax=Truncatella angustata TaxID=152316 RepID=A0A9P8UCS5_9PEZI|nr:uncharacterized protein BKA67DRAFT_96281 [Truncatella angustata]KAH6646192.1 hypothetical protein BKA67DRAFT_96281 [Truncatella angustata]